MKKAIQIAYNELFEKKCEFASEGGFEYIAVNFTEMINKTQKDWDQAIENIERILEKTNIKCIQSHPYYYDLRISSEIQKEECEFSIKQAIRASGKLGASWCALHPRTSITSGYRISKSYEDNKNAILSYLDVAAKHNTGIAAENLPIFPDVIPVMPFYSSDYEDLLNLVDSINSPNLGICWDTGHANLMHFNQAEAIKFLGKRIKCTHIHNNYQKEDTHYPPDNGNINWADVMSAFASIGYDGPLTLETHCKYPTDMLLKNFAKHNYGCLLYLENIIRGGQI